MTLLLETLREVGQLRLWILRVVELSFERNIFRQRTHSNCGDTLLRACSYSTSAKAAGSFGFSNNATGWGNPQPSPFIDPSISVVQFID